MPRQRRANTEKSQKFKYKNRNQINKTTNQKLPAHEFTVCWVLWKKGKTVTFSLLFQFVGVALFLLPPFLTWAHNNNKNNKTKNTSAYSLVCVPVFRNNNGKTVFFSSHFSEPNLQYNENRKTNELVYMRTNETLKHRARVSERSEEEKKNQQKKNQQKYTQYSKTMKIDWFRAKHTWKCAKKNGSIQRNGSKQQ